jgi:hypothetical protein
VRKARRRGIKNWQVEPRLDLLVSIARASSANDRLVFRFLHSLVILSYGSFFELALSEALYIHDLEAHRCFHQSQAILETRVVDP